MLEGCKKGNRGGRWPPPANLHGIYNVCIVYGNICVEPVRQESWLSHPRIGAKSGGFSFARTTPCPSPRPTTNRERKGRNKGRQKSMVRNLLQVQSKGRQQAMVRILLQVQSKGRQQAITHNKLRVQLRSETCTRTNGRSQHETRSPRPSCRGTIRLPSRKYLHSLCLQDKDYRRQRNIYTPFVLKAIRFLQPLRFSGKGYRREGGIVVPRTNA